MKQSPGTTQGTALSGKLLGGLTEAHVKGQGMLDLLEGAAKALGKGEKEQGLSDISLVLQFFATDLERHFRHEEQALFPPLIRAVGRGGPVGAMLEEHQSFWRSIDRLEELVASLRKEASITQMLSSPIERVAAHICWLLRSHIQKEDSMLFPLALEQLSASDWTEMETAMSQLK